MRWRGLPGKRWAPIREGVTTTARSGWGTSNGNPWPRAAGYHPRVSGSTTRSRLAALLAGPWNRAAAALVAVAVFGAAAQGGWRALHDPLRPARWIGLDEAAARALPAEVAFAREFVLVDPLVQPLLDVEGDREWKVTLDGRPVAKGVGPGPRRFRLPGPLPAGSHLLAAFVRHPAGVSGLRLRLADASGKGIGVVTGRGWGADDDASRVRDRGLKGARYRAMVWGRPPLSSWSASSVTSSLSWNGASSIDVESSRIPSRAEAQ